jgi:hypothetical protein
MNVFKFGVDSGVIESMIEASKCQPIHVSRRCSPVRAESSIERGVPSGLTRMLSTIIWLRGATLLTGVEEIDLHIKIEFLGSSAPLA